MDSDLNYRTSSPAAANALKIPFLKKFQSSEVDETDGEASLNGRDEDTSSSRSRKPGASLTVTGINHRGEQHTVYGIQPYMHGCHMVYGYAHMRVQHI
jgi:hypothetical protein